MAIQTKRKHLAFFLFSFLTAFSAFSLCSQTAQAAKKMSLAKTSGSVVIGGAQNIKVKNAGKGARISYRSSKPSIAAVSKKGKVTGIKAGTAKIAVAVKNGTKKTSFSYRLTVKKPLLSKTNLSVPAGKTVSLSVRNRPAKTARAKYTWASGSPRIASVKNGKVTGIAAGTANIRLKVASGKKFSYLLTCKVSVTEDGTPPDPAKPSDFDQFAKDGAELIKENNQSYGTTITADNEFSSRRLIIRSKGKELDFSRFGPKAVVKSADGIYLVQFSSASATKAAYLEITKWPDVEWAEPDVYTNVDASGDISASSKSWGVARIGADKYAASLSSIRTAISVAVVDTGVSASHPFLKGRVKNGYDFVDNDTNADDKHYHGTHVAGTVVDCTPKLNVRILPVRVLDAGGRGAYFNVANGIKYAADHGAKVINLSLGGGHGIYIDESISYAVKKGVVVVAAAGNENDNTAYHCPAHITKAIVVAAVDKNNRRAKFSNFGSSVDVAAPGVSIMSCVPGGKYQRLSGTSMATPHVAAVAAMFRLKYPSKTPAQIEALIKKNVKDLGSPGWDKYYGYGIPSLHNIKPVQPTGITLNKSSVSITTGKSVTLTATIQPANATETAVSWSSSNTTIAKVSNGTVTGISAGTATITASTSNKKKATCKVTVTAPIIQPTGIQLNKTTVTLEEGDTAALTATVLPANAANKTVTWQSSNLSVASVNNGKITAISPGAASITARTINGKEASCTIYVTAKVIVPTGITLDKTAFTVNADEVIGITPTVLPASATDKTVTWQSSNPSIAEVYTVDSARVDKNKGHVKGKSPGTVTITASTYNGKTASCTVTVTVPARSILLDNTDITVDAGSAKTLTATIRPDNTTDKTIVWKSSNPSVATVQNGKVTGISPGNARITATTANGRSTYCDVTVIMMPSGVSLDKTSISIKRTETATLTATVSPSNAANKSVTWQSSNTKVATVNRGLITGVSAGTATITAKTVNGKTASCIVTVKEILPEKVSVTAPYQFSPLYMGVTEKVELKAAVTPDNAAQKSVKWTTSNSSVVTVDADGKVTGIASGNATITATTQNGIKDSISITVKPAIIKTEPFSYYKGEIGSNLLVDANIYLEKPLALNDKKYVLYYAYRNGNSWEELGSYNIDGKSYFEERWNCDAKIHRYEMEGHKIKVWLSYNTADLKEMDENMFVMSLFPYNNFSSGKSLHDSIFFVTLFGK